MRHGIRSLLIALALVVLGAPALAQSPSVEPGPASGPPQVGVPVVVASQEGATLVTITVDEVDSGYDEFSEFFDPDPDSDYIGVVYTFAGGDELIEVSTYNLTLETAGGFLWHSGFVGRPEDVEVLDLESSFNLSPDESETGIVIFAVPAGAELVRLWWQPELDRLVELADLRES